MTDFINIERYRLILKHEFLTKDGTQKMDEPLVIEYMIPKFSDINYNDRPYMLNEMMEKLKFELLERASK